MKKNIIIPALNLALAVCLLYSVSSCSQPQTDTGASKTSAVKVENTTIAIENNYHKFGKIHDGDTVHYQFVFTNTGKVPYIIHDVSTTCGCTLVEWSKKPVLPNQKGTVTIQFSKHHDPGLHYKHIIMKGNTKNPYTLLHFSAEVTA